MTTDTSHTGSTYDDRYLNALAEYLWILDTDVHRTTSHCRRSQCHNDMATTTSRGGPAQIPFAKSPRSLKECVNSNPSKNDRLLTDNGQDTHHKNGVPLIDPSSHQHNYMHSTLHPTPNAMNGESAFVTA
jgi:hypothetical protein